MVGTWVEGIEAVRRSGVTVRDGESHWRVAMRAANDPADLPPVDVALLLVKSHQTERAAKWAARVLAPDGVAVTLQNGLNNLPRLAAAVGSHRATAGATYLGAMLLGPGDVRHTAKMSTHIGTRPAISDQISVLVDLLCQSGLTTETTEELDTLLWRKALANAAINPLTALWRIPNGKLLDTPDRRALLAAVVQEAVSVAVAAGIDLALKEPVAHVEGVCRGTAGNRSSMYQDIERGRRTEIDSINGVIVQLGDKLGVPTPVNETLCRLIRGLQASHE